MTEESFGVKELLLGNTYQLQKSAILMTLTDSPSPSASSTPTKETPTTPITTTRVRHSEPVIQTPLGKRVRKRDRFFRHSVDNSNLSVFYIDSPNPELQKEEAWIEETDSTVRMDEINPEFQEIIQAIENDGELQAKVNFALDNWIGTRVTNSANTLDLFLSILGREFGGSDDFDDVITEQLKQDCKPQFDRHPHLEILVSDVTFHRTKKSDKYFLKFTVNTNTDHAKAFNLSSLHSNSHKIFYENVERDIMNVDVLLSGKVIGRVFVPLREIHPNQGPVGWNIRDVNGDQEMGYLVLNLNLVNADKPSVNTCLNRQIHDMLFNNFDSDLFGCSAKDKVGFRKFEYFLQIVENVVDESSNMFLKSSKLIENRSKMRHNRVKVITKNGVAFSKIKSVTEDEIKIKLYRVDNRSPNTVRRALDFGDSLEHTDPDTSAENIVPGDTEKTFLGSLTTKFQNLSPSGGAKTCENVKKKMDMVYFEKIIAISDIPWSEGLTISQGEFTWTLNIVGAKPGDEEKLPQPIFTEKNLADIMLLAYYRTLGQCSLDALATWNGNLSRMLRMVLNCITPCGLSADWKKAHAKAIFTLHKELFPDLNASVLNKHLINLNDEALLQFFQEFCITAVATFDARQKYSNSQMESILESLSSLSTDDVQLRLEESMSSYVKTVIVTGGDSKIAFTLKSSTHQLQQLSNILDSFCIATLKIISDKFGNFGLDTWCPLLAKNFIKNGLKEFDAVRCAHEAEHYGNPNRLVEFYENSFLIFTQFREIGRYTRLVEDVYHQFEFCLPHWADCAAAKAAIQVARVLAMERERQNPNEPASVEKKENRSPGKVLDDFKENLRTKVGRPSSTHQADMIPPTGDRDSWFLTDEDFLAWNESAVNVNGIFRSCEVSWHKLQWIEPIKSITKFGSPLFHKLNLVFKMYLDGMRQIVMLDNEFDKHELVLILNNCFHSMKYLDNFSYSLGSEVQRVADQMTEDNEEIKESIRAVQEQFAEAKFEAEKQADEIVTAFCEGQRKHFQQLISFRKTSRGSVTSECKVDDDEATFDFRNKNLLLDYLDKMLFFFNENLNTGLQNEILAQKCNDKLKVRLFQISDEEIVKFYESANSLYEKCRDPSVFADLNKTISGSLEFRENVGLKNTGTLDEIRKKLVTQVATPVDLISNYMLEIFQLKQELAKISEETFGKVTFAAGLSGATGSSSLKLFVQLKGVANLRPRQNKDECNFRIVVSVLPLKVDEKNYKVSLKSLIYPATINHLFDIPSDDDSVGVDSSNYNFVFELFNLFDSRSEKTTFIDVSLFDVSVTKTNMMFRGNVIFKMSQIPIVSDEKELNQNPKCNFQGVFTQIPTLTDDNNSFVGQISWDELSKRKDDMSKSFAESQEKFQREKRIVIVPHRDDWANHQRSPKKSCLFPSRFYK